MSRPNRVSPLMKYVPRGPEDPFWYNNCVLTPLQIQLLFIQSWVSRTINFSFYTKVQKKRRTFWSINHCSTKKNKPIDLLLVKRKRLGLIDDFGGHAKMKRMWDGTVPGINTSLDMFMSF